jgi:ABC-type branched-subunit amino acid transport system substrate-binding protein
LERDVVQLPEADMRKKFLAAMLAVSAAWAAAPAGAVDGVTSDRILLGQSAAFTGPAAQLGIQMRNGIKAYFDFVNAKGGVHGRKLELKSLDDGY